MEAICSSETSVATHQTTRRYIPEDDTLHNHRCGNLKSYVSIPASKMAAIETSPIKQNFLENGSNNFDQILAICEDHLPT
jgi:hypothetical protein